MTKKWSSTASLDGQTKRQASKGERKIGKKIAPSDCEGCDHQEQAQKPQPVD